MEDAIATGTDRLSQQCVTFLLKPEALDPYRSKSPSRSA
jgi:hypothetical protein